MTATRRLYGGADLTAAEVVARLAAAATAASKACAALQRPEHPDDRENLAILLDDFMLLFADASGRVEVLTRQLDEQNERQLARSRGELRP